MTITIHRHLYRLIRADGRQLYSQICWTFESILGGHMISSATGIQHLRTASEPLTVSVPAFSRVESGRLVLDADPTGWPAVMVAGSAEGKRGGFSWVE